MATNKAWEKPIKKNAFDYTFLEVIEAGVVLEGWEVKSLTNNSNFIFDGAYVKNINGELFLVGASIHGNDGNNHDPNRFRKLLMKRRDIDRLSSKAQIERLTIVPVSLVYTGRYFKVKIALARGKNHADKRETIKKRDLNRENSRNQRTN